MRLSLSPRGAFSSLPLVPAVLVALAVSGCPETPDEPRKASLILDLARNSTDIGESIAVTFKSRGADGAGNNADVVATVAPKAGTATLPGALALDDAGLAGATETLTITPVDGEGAFVFGCSGEGSAVLTVTTGDITKTEDLTCRQPDIELELDVDLFPLGCSTLQADGSSSCEVIVTLKQVDEDGVRSDAADFPITAKVDTLSNVTSENAGSINGDADVLATEPNGNGQEELSGLRTDENGRVSFFVVSPEFKLEQQIDFTVSAGAESTSLTVVIGTFNDLSAVEITADRDNITSGETIELTVTALDTDGTAADGKVATVRLPAGAGFIPAAGDGLVINGDVITVTLDADGERAITVVAPTVDDAETFSVDAEFQAISQSLVKTADVDITVKVSGSVTTNAVLDRATINAEGVPQRKAVLTLTATQDDLDFNGATATVRVALASRAVIKLESASVGDANTAVPLIDSDNAAFAAFVDGKATVDIIADTDESRGVGTIEVEIVADGEIDTRTFQIIVEREPKLQSIIYVGSNPADGIIGVQGSPLQTTAVLTFKLLDDANEPIPGLVATFTENASDPTVSVIGDVPSAADGTITAILNAGRVSGPVTVRLEATFGDRTLSANSLPIAIIAGVPNSAISFLTCDSKAQFDPFTTDCSLLLADRFTNVVTVNTNVQFRAESGNIAGVGASADGVATSTFAFGTPGPGSADVRNWSFGAITDLTAAEKTIPEIAGCFDDTTLTPCDLITLCDASQAPGNNPRLQAFCPLQPNATSTGSCVTDLSAPALAALQDQGFGDRAIDYQIEALTNDDARADVDVDTQVAAYNIEHRTCGFPLSCLQARRAGLFFDSSDNCPVNTGCLDFSAGTECPQDGLLDILAGVNGEEGFDDRNGNGVREANEDFIDYPEPFLDKNSSCSFDDLNDVARLLPGEKIRLSDLFIDDGDGVFGFAGAPGEPRTETNGVHDLSTEISFKTTILHLRGGRGFEFGEPVDDVSDCGVNLGGLFTCSEASGGGFSQCQEVATGEVFAPSCLPQDVLRDGEKGEYVFRWTDANGNCPSVDLADERTVTVTGPVLFTADQGPLDAGACGIDPGTIGSGNSARPWCEEHAFMGAPLNDVSFTVKCDGLEDLQPVEMVFGLGDATETITFNVNCPTCGDNVVEGVEECDNGGGIGCGADCVVDEEFTCTGSPSVCTANP